MANALSLALVIVIALALIAAFTSRGHRLWERTSAAARRGGHRARGLRAAFSSIPFIACDRSAALPYAVDATVKGATALVWAPYGQGSEFEDAPEMPQLPYQPPAPADSLTHPVELSEGVAERAAQQAALEREELGEERAALRGEREAEDPGWQFSHRREGFEPVPDLPCGRPTEDAVEYSVDETLRGAPAPQGLLYSTIAGDVPGLGVQNPVENESDNTVTHLWDYSRVPRWQDPYLTDAAAFGRSPYGIPPGDPGSMEEITDFMEAFSPRPKIPLITAVTGRSAPRSHPSTRARNISRLVEGREGFTDDGFGGNDSDLASTRFNRAPILSKRARGRR